jgi:26S proteasome regulatory subunit N3
LRSNVIKAGLRKINLAYSKISISDICKKLALESEEDAESMVVKAIADGVIEATVDRQNKVLLSKDIQDVYSSSEPQAAFHKRIQFTLDIHQQAVKALRYPPNAHKAHNHDEWSDEEDEDTISGNPPDKREEDNKKKD